MRAASIQSSRCSACGGLDQRAQEQRVPPEQHLVVEAGPDAVLACREQRRQDGGDRLGAVLGRTDGVEDVAAVAGVRVLEVAACGHAEVADDVGQRVAAELLELLERPHVELALDALGVGVLGGEEPAVGVAQVAQHVRDGLLDDAAVAVGAGDHPAVQVGADEERLVVEHLLEVGDEPVRVDRVAVEAAADLVVDAAGGHGVERAGDHLQHLGRGSGRWTVAATSSRNVIVIAWGNFGARPKPPKRGSNCSCEVRDRAVEDGGRRARRGAAPPIAVLSLDGAACSCSACWSSSSRRWRHASSMASSSRTNPGMPWRSSGGK